MSTEAKQNSLGQLAKDSVGITAYQWVHDEKPNLNPMLRTTLGIALGVREVFVPALSRFERESNFERSLGNSLRRLTTFPRDGLTYVLSMGAFLGTAVATDIPGASLAAFLLSKFILNGVIHYEFNRHS